MSQWGRLCGNGQGKYGTFMFNSAHWKFNCQSIGDYAILLDLIAILFRKNLCNEIQFHPTL